MDLAPPRRKRPISSASPPLGICLAVQYSQPALQVGRNALASFPLGGKARLIFYQLMKGDCTKLDSTRRWLHARSYRRRWQVATAADRIATGETLQEQRRARPLRCLSTTSEYLKFSPLQTVHFAVERAWGTVTSAAMWRIFAHIPTSSPRTWKAVPISPNDLRHRDARKSWTQSP